MSLDIVFLEPRAFLATGTLTPQDHEPSLGLMCLAAFLERHHPDLAWEVLDPTLLGSRQRLAEALAATDARFVGIPFNLTRTYADSVDLARLARQCLPGSRIVVGGNHATCATEELLGEVPEIDVVIRGEAEQTLAELLRGAPPASVAGLVFREAGELRFTAARVPPQDLDAYPSPYLVADRFQLSRRLEAVRGYFDDTIFGRMVLTSRGCPFDCEFCTNGCVTGRRMRYHGAGFVQQAVQFVRQRFLPALPFPVVNLTDAIFTAHRERTLALSAALEGSGVEFHCQTRVECCDAQVLDALQRMHMACVSLGIETLTPEILERNGKRFDAPTLRELVDGLHRRGLRAVATFIVGLPGETEASMLENARAAAWCGFDEAYFFPLVAVRGSRIYQRLLQEVPPERREPLGRRENREWLYTAEFPGEELRRLARESEALYRRG